MPAYAQPEKAGAVGVLAPVETHPGGSRPGIEVPSEPVERREHGRVPVALDVSAWTPAQPTRRLAGTTVNLSPGGALLSIPDLAPHAATLELRIALPDGPLGASTAIRWRRLPALVGVELVRIAPEHQARLVEFLRSRTR